LSDKKYGGTGLGLTITMRLVELMGGTISLSSELGKGSTFIICIPDVVIVKEFTTGQVEKAFDIRNVHFRKSKILVVDDNYENRKLVVDLLETSALELIEAANGKEAIQMATNFLPDLILMDLRMPEMSGYEATMILKSQESTKNIPVIVLSASPKIVMNGSSNKDIFDDFIMKPIIIADLVEHLKKYLPHDMESPDHSDPAVKTVQKMTTQQKQLARGLITTLENEFLPVYREILARQVISEIEKFGKNLEGLGEKSGIKLITDYGITICSHAENFDIEQLMEKLRSFPEIIGRLKKLAKT